MANRSMLRWVVLETALLLLGSQSATSAATIRTATVLEQAVNTAQADVRKLEVGHAVERDLS